MATTSNPELPANGLVSFGIAVTGMTAFAIFAMQFVLAAGLPWINDSFGAKAVFGLHKWMAMVATAFVFAHISLLVWSRGNWNLVLSPRVGWSVFLGRMVVVTIMVTLVFSLNRKRIPINQADWRWFHSALAWLILVAGFVHSITIGSSVEVWGFAFVWTGYFLIAILAWCWQKYRR